MSSFPQPGPIKCVLTGTWRVTLWDTRKQRFHVAASESRSRNTLKSQTISFLITHTGSTGELVQMSKTSQQNTVAETNGVSVIYTPAHTSGLQQVPQLVPVSPGGGGKATPPSKQGKKNSLVDRNSDEYRQRRERNNMAVKKSRLKSKQKAQDTLQRVNQLKEENERLEAKIKLLTKELSVLKDLFLEHAHNFTDSAQPLGTENSAAHSDASGQ